MLASTVLAAFLALIASFAYCQDVAPIIEIKGSKFFYANDGSQFFIKGLVYQETSAGEDFGHVSANLERTSIPFQDILGDEFSCARDLPHLQRLQINLIRSYSIVNTDHDECMNALAAAGIYTLIDLSQAGLIIARSNPVWNAVLYDQFTMVIDAMHKYTNVFGFIVGNQVVEINSDAGKADNTRYIRAAVRDMKAYMREKNYRAIPVGYVDFDYAISWFDNLYCGNSDETIDFLGVDFDEPVCSSIPSTTRPNAFDLVSDGHAQVSLPIFVASLPCHQVSEDRSFREVPFLYDDTVTPVWSGNIIYEYFQRGDANYGLVQLSRSRERVHLLDSYDALSSQLESVSPSSTNAADYTTSTTPATNCDSVRITDLPPNPVAVAASSSSADVSSSSADASPSSTEISNSVRVGLGTGAGLVAAIAIGVALLFVLNRRRRRRREKERADHEQQNTPKFTTDNLNPDTPEDDPQTDDSNARAEVEGNDAVAEVPSDRQVYEKAGDGDSIRELPGTLHHNELSGNEAAPFLVREK